MNNRITPYRYRTMQFRSSRRLLGVALSLTVVVAGSVAPTASAGPAFPDGSRTPAAWSDCLTRTPSLGRMISIASFNVRARANALLTCGRAKVREVIRRGGIRKGVNTGFGVRHIHANHGYDSYTNGCIARALREYDRVEREDNKDIYRVTLARVAPDGGPLYGFTVHSLTASVVVGASRGVIITAYTSTRINGATQPGSGSWYSCSSGRPGLSTPQPVA